MALIDKETIRAEIERRLSLIYLLEGDFTDGSRDAYEGLLSWLETHPEQPDSEEKFRNLLDAMGDCGFSQDNILLLKSIWEDAYSADKKAVKEIVKTVHKEVTRQVKEMVGRQPVEGLNEEIRKYLLDHNIINHSEEGWKRYAEQVARHFAEWGAENLKK